MAPALVLSVWVLASCGTPDATGDGIRGSVIDPPIEKPDFVLADVRMNGMTGLELCAELKARSSLATAILMSAYAGWTVDDYADPKHPSQRAVLAIIASLILTFHSFVIGAALGAGAPTMIR